MNRKIAKLIETLEKNNITCLFLEKSEDVVPTVQSLLHMGDVVCAGGSATLEETGVLKLLQNGGYYYTAHRHVSDSTGEVVSPPIFTCDTFLTGANAITEAGEIYNVDGSSNRIAPLLYGSKQVIIVAGTNKIVPTLEDAICRVKTYAAPRNARAKGKHVYCAEHGICVSLVKGRTGMTDGCSSPDRICNSFSVIARQHPLHKDRIKILLVNESLGF